MIKKKLLYFSKKILYFTDRRIAILTEFDIMKATEILHPMEERCYEELSRIYRYTTAQSLCGGAEKADARGTSHAFLRGV
jgi:hypothetical protein